MPPPPSVDPKASGPSRVRPAATKLSKLARLVGVPLYRRGLARGVAASVEHGRVRFGCEFRTVVDAGAHQGQFALFCARRFPSADIHCFEPLPEPRERLTSLAAEVISQLVTIHPLALGAEASQSVVHVSRRDDSSSLLAIGAEQTRVFPGTEEVGTVTTKVARLDSVLTAADVTGPALLKIDVQGYELEVLRGAEALLDRFDELLVEASFTELYEGQAGAEEIVAHLFRQGFRLVGVYGLAMTPEGAPAQADFHFRRTG